MPTAVAQRRTPSLNLQAGTSTRTSYAGSAIIRQRDAHLARREASAGLGLPKLDARAGENKLEVKLERAGMSDEQRKTMELLRSGGDLSLIIPFFASKLSFFLSLSPFSTHSYFDDVTYAIAAMTPRLAPMDEKFHFMQQVNTPNIGTLNVVVSNKKK